MENVERVNMEEYSKQLRDSLINTPHSVVLEAIIPPIDLKKIEEEKQGSIEPYIATKSNNGCNAVTVAMLVYSLELYIKNQLKKPDIKLAHAFVTNMLIDHSLMFDSEKIRRDDENE